MTFESLMPPKPKLRGVLHQIAFYVSLVTGPTLVALARSGIKSAAAVFSLAMTGLFGVSALYHRLNWQANVRRWLGRLDHTMIYIFIAGSFTPIALAADTRWSRIVLVIAWSAAVLGVLIGLLPISTPKSVAVIPYLALGWLGVTLFPGIFQRAGWTPTLLLLLGGVAYTIGAVIYARRRPDPRPAVFGYHEIFHALVIGGAYLHYVAIAATIA
ncbi:MAG TPA: hemolysin III family protein [Actinomycetota bacterium]|nr:hemolysin III family protein [Actinomycetota bacterium]